MDKNCTKYIIGAVIALASLVGLWFAYQKMTYDPVKAIAAAEAKEKADKDIYDAAKLKYDNLATTATNAIGEHKGAVTASNATPSDTDLKTAVGEKLTAMNEAVTARDTDKSAYETAHKNYFMAKGNHEIAKAHKSPIATV